MLSPRQAMRFSVLLPPAPPTSGPDHPGRAFAPRGTRPAGASGVAPIASAASPARAAPQAASRLFRSSPCAAARAPCAKFTAALSLDPTAVKEHETQKPLPHPLYYRSNPRTGNASWGTSGSRTDGNPTQTGIYVAPSLACLILSRGPSQSRCTACVGKTHPRADLLFLWQRNTCLSQGLRRH